MNFKEMIRSDYYEYIQLHKHTFPDGLFESLKVHERVPRFVDNMAKEFHQAELKLGKIITREKLKAAVYSMAELFIFNVKKMAQEKQMSELEKARLKKDFEEKQSLQAGLDGITEIDHTKIL